MNYYERMCKEMKIIIKIKEALKEFINAAMRFPLTSVCLIIAASINAISINQEKDIYAKYIVTLLIGALLGIVAQIVYERFYKKESKDENIVNFHKSIFAYPEAFLNIGAVALMAVYYLIVKDADKYNEVLMVRTSASALMLFISFIWIPSIKKEISFNDTFIAVFKAFFISLFFSTIMFAGSSIVLSAIDRLLTAVNYKAFPHTANIVYVIFAPMFFLSLIPSYHIKNSEDEEKQNKAISCPKYLAILISYIIIPITAAFTIILILYILRNIRGEFWTDNLLEPMLVAYSITVILLYFLASKIENAFSKAFRKIIPKVLVPIVLIQTIASVLKIGDMGITHGRYYVIIYGIFSIIAGIVFCVLPIKKNGIVAIFLIVLTMLSLTPPIDAFSVSQNSQIAVLENTLKNNKMLENGKITANDKISDADKSKIVATMSYLSYMEHLDKLKWLPEKFEMYRDFKTVFGFNEYDIPVGAEGKSINVSKKQTEPINITEYDVMVNLQFYNEARGYEKNEDIIFKHNGKGYKIIKDNNYNFPYYVLLDENGKELISFNTEEFFKKFETQYTRQGEIPLEEAIFNNENEQAKFTVIINYIDLYQRNNKYDYGGDIDVLIDIK